MSHFSSDTIWPIPQEDMQNSIRHCGMGQIVSDEKWLIEKHL